MSIVRTTMSAICSNSLKTSFNILSDLKIQVFRSFKMILKTAFILFLAKIVFSGKFCFFKQWNWSIHKLCHQKTSNFVTDDYYDYYNYDDNNCITNGGEKLKEPCVFPFVFKGKTCHACPLGTNGKRKGHIVISP